MKLKKFLAGVIAAAILASVMLSASATAVIGDINIEPPSYEAFSGKVTHVSYPMDANLLTTTAPTYVYAENDGEELTFLVYRESTYWITENKNNQIEIGADFTGIYYNDPAAPMIMIYPPQYKAEAIAVNLPKAQSVKLDRFDENFISSDNMLKLNITDKTKIAFEDGKKFDGKAAELAGRKLLVIYDISMESMPVQTSPLEIIIFYEKASPPIYMLSDEDKKTLNQALEGAVVQVNGKAIDKRAFISESGYIMVQMRAVAAAMGYRVEWFGDTKTSQIGRSHSFTIGRDAYAYNRMAPVSLGQAPVLKDNLAYVPVDFFTSPDLGAISPGYISWFDDDLKTSVINIIFE